MSFNPNIPLGTDNILQSYGQLRANFQSIEAAFNNNHISLTADPTTTGKHRFLTMRPQTTDPTTTATQASLYTKLVAGLPQLFFRPNSSQTAIQLTSDNIKTDGSLTQYTFLAGPFIVYGGRINRPINQGQAVTLSPGSQLIYVDLLQVDSNLAGTTTLVPTGIAGTTFHIHYTTTASNPNNLFDVFYFAIGL